MDTYSPSDRFSLFPVCLSQNLDPHTLFCRDTCMLKAGNSIAWWFIMNLWKLYALNFSSRSLNAAISALALLIGVSMR